MKVAIAEESRPGHWVVNIEDGDARVALTFEWLERLSPVSPALGVVETCLHWEPPAERYGEGVPRTITASHLRDAPWSRWLFAARTRLDDHLDEVERRHNVPPYGRVLAAHPEFGEVTPQAERRRQAHLRLVLVADQYRRNVLRGLPDPVKSIAEEWEVAPATARSWVYRARKEGYLEPHQAASKRQPSTAEKEDS